MLREEIDRALQDVDVLVAPTVFRAAPLLSEVTLESNFSVPQLTAPFSVSGSPTISICIGFDRRGLPLGLQIAGRRGEDAVVLRVAHAFQQRTDYHRQHPREVPVRGLVPAPERLVWQASGRHIPADVATFGLQQSGIEVDALQLDQIREAGWHLRRMREMLSVETPWSVSPV